jgi:Fe-S-cluster containining protein
MSEPRELIKPHELLKRTRVAVYDAANEARGFADELGDVTCRRGCTNCCHQKVISTPSEGLSIYLYIRDEGRWSEALEARLAEEDAHATRTSHSDWFKEKRPCPFLKNDSCSIYPVRPVGCITTFSTGDPNYCGRSDIESRVGHGQMQIHAPLAPAMWQLACLHMSIDQGIGVMGFMTLAGAVLAGARHATKREPRRSLVIGFGDYDGGAGGLIEKFDAKGKDFA